ncbi:hypothetical protein GCM10022261_09350 [Brevibacterium daeguense]|uniref:Uncharacterized protein n=1 Tax=Brevibacterium daeguense TaxID=909936 RepID=A0ABP8EHG3_9MICO
MRVVAGTHERRRGGAGAFGDLPEHVSQYLRCCYRYGFTVPAGTVRVIRSAAAGDCKQGDGEEGKPQPALGRRGRHGRRGR